MMIKLALAGNPNSGKTTLFNLLTGSKQKVGNWPGVTVEKKEGFYRKNHEIILQDLPGIYSLSPYTLEEVVSRDYLVHEKPQGIINIIDGTNLERNLYLTLQLLELNIPVVAAINMMDLVKERKDEIDLTKISESLGCPVVEISALKNLGIDRLMEKAVKETQKKSLINNDSYFPIQIKNALDGIKVLIKGKVDSSLLDWYSIKLFERDKLTLEKLSMDPSLKNEIERIIQKCEKEMDDDSESLITNARYDWITQITKESFIKNHPENQMSLSDKIDKIVTNKILALPIFILIMLFVYSAAMGSFPFSIGTMTTDWTNDVLFGEWVPNWIDSLLTALKIDPVLASLIQDGIVAGVGATLGFVPQMLVLFFLLALMEDCGYMARVAFIMDRLFRRFGLSGKSFIPLLVATGCGVPGIMASRTIEQDRDRKLTIMTTGFIPCGAKMPIIGLFAGALFGGSALVGVSAFFIGIAAVIITGVMLKKIKVFAGNPAPFVIELPAYHMPSLRNVFHSTFERGWSFIKRAGTLILASSIVLWFLQSFGFNNGILVMVEDNNHSLLADIGNAVSWIFYPLGWVGDMAWKATVATFTGLIAKEEVVSTFGVLYNFAGEISEEGNEIWAAVAADFSIVSAYSFMIFNLLCAPCFAAMGAIKKEMNNTKWTVFAIGYMCLFAYVAALIVYQLGGYILGMVPFNFFTVVALLLLGGIIYMLFRKGYEERQSSIIAIEANA